MREGLLAAVCVVIAVVCELLDMISKVCNDNFFDTEGVSRK